MQTFETDPALRLLDFEIKFNGITQTGAVRNVKELLNMHENFCKLLRGGADRKVHR